MEDRGRTATLADGRYELVRRVGRGSSGEVWLADDTVLGREVAIKRADVPHHLSDPERDRVRRRLEREARAAARLQRPGVVPLFDVRVGEDTVDLVMAFVDAPTLQQLVADRGPLAPQEAARIGLTILSVLEAAHQQGIVHRDVKPSNVLVDDDGVHITDFGIAALTDDTDLTRTGTTLGSPSYMPPEQATGAPAAPPADLWGLGATLYFALTGRPPFARDRAIATVHAVVHEPHEPVEGAEGLGALIDRLLAKDPDDRPAPDEVRGALEAVAAAPSAAAPTEVLPSDPVPAPVPVPDALPADEPAPRSAPDPEPAADAGRGRRWLAVALVGGLLAVIAIVVLTSPPPSGAPDQADAPVAGADPEAAGDATDAAPTGDDGGTEAGSADEAADPAEPDAAAGDLPEPTAPPTTGPDGATEDDGAGETRDGSVPEGWQVFEGSTYEVAVPAGWQVREDSGNRVDLVDPDTGAYLRVDWTDEPASDPEADWEAKEPGFADRYPSYERIRLEDVGYRDYPAAMWEYTYTADGQDLHAYNLGFVAAEHGYALNYQTPASAWDDMEPLFDDIRASFEPTP